MVKYSSKELAVLSTASTALAVSSLPSAPSTKQLQQTTHRAFMHTVEEVTRQSRFEGCHRMNAATHLICNSKNRTMNDKCKEVCQAVYHSTKPTGSVRA